MSKRTFAIALSLSMCMLKASTSLAEPPKLPPMPQLPYLPKTVAPKKNTARPVPKNITQPAPKAAPAIDTPKPKLPTLPNKAPSMAPPGLPSLDEPIESEEVEAPNLEDDLSPPSLRVPLKVEPEPLKEPDMPIMLDPKDEDPLVFDEEVPEVAEPENEAPKAPSEPKPMPVMEKEEAPEPEPVPAPELKEEKPVEIEQEEKQEALEPKPEPVEEKADEPVVEPKEEVEAAPEPEKTSEEEEEINLDELSPTQLKKYRTRMRFERRAREEEEETEETESTPADVIKEEKTKKAPEPKEDTKASEEDEVLELLDTIEEPAEAKEETETAPIPDPEDITEEVEEDIPAAELEEDIQAPVSNDTFTEDEVEELQEAETVPVEPIEEDLPDAEPIPTMELEEEVESEDNMPSMPDDAKSSPPWKEEGDDDVPAELPDVEESEDIPDIPALDDEGDETEDFPEMPSDADIPSLDDDAFALPDDLPNMPGAEEVPVEEPESDEDLDDLLDAIIQDVDEIQEQGIDAERTIIDPFRETEPKGVKSKLPPQKDFKRTKDMPDVLYRNDADGRNKHLPLRRDREFLTDSLFSAATRGNVNGVRELANLGIDVNSQNVYGNTPLFNSVLHNNLSATRMLLIRGANPNMQNRLGFTPLHLAAHQGNVLIAQALVLKGANPNIYNNYDVSPLQLAANSGHLEVVKLLLDNGARRETRFLSELVQNPDMMRTIKQEVQPPVSDLRENRAERDHVEQVLRDIESGNAGPVYSLPKHSPETHGTFIERWKALDGALHDDNVTEEQRVSINSQRKAIQRSNLNAIKQLDGEDLSFWMASMKKWDMWEQNKNFLAFLRYWRQINDRFELLSEDEKIRFWDYSKAQLEYHEDLFAALNPDIKEQINKQIMQRWGAYDDKLNGAPAQPAPAPTRSAPPAPMPQKQ